MKLYLRYILPLFLVLGITSGCTDSLSEVDKEETERSTARRTVLVYMVAENSLSTATQNDISELAYAANHNTIPSDCNILVYNDDASQPVITLYNRLGANTWKTYTERNSADSTVMLATLQEMVKNYPSEHYALVLWSHGSGWAPTEKTKKELEQEHIKSLSAPRQARAFGIDNQANNYANGAYQMNISSVKWVLDKLGVHMDYILWDACLMQGIEVAYELRNQADWIIGSPTETPGNGAPYHTAAAGLCNADMEAILKAYTNYYDNSANYLANFPLSCIKTSELEALAKATAPLIRKYFADKDATPEGVATAQIYSPKIFISATNNGKYNVGTPIAYDMGSVMGKILTEEEYGRWRPLLDKAVPYKTLPTQSLPWMSSLSGSEHRKLTDKEHYSGISMNVPQEDYDRYFPDKVNHPNKYLYLGWNTYFRRLSWWKAGGWSLSGWNE